MSSLTHIYIHIHAPVYMYIHMHAPVYYIHTHRVNLYRIKIIYYTGTEIKM